MKQVSFVLGYVKVRILKETMTQQVTREEFDKVLNDLKVVIILTVNSLLEW